MLRVVSCNPGAQQISTAKCGKFNKFQADAAKTAQTQLLSNSQRLILEVCDTVQCFEWRKCLKFRAAGLGIS